MDISKIIEHFIPSINHNYTFVTPVPTVINMVSGMNGYIFSISFGQDSATIYYAHNLADMDGKRIETYETVLFASNKNETAEQIAERISDKLDHMNISLIPSQ